MHSMSSFYERLLEVAPGKSANEQSSSQRKGGDKKFWQGRNRRRSRPDKSEKRSPDKFVEQINAVRDRPQPSQPTPAQSLADPTLPKAEGVKQDTKIESSKPSESILDHDGTIWVRST